MWKAADPNCGSDLSADKVRRNADASCITMTKLADSLMRPEGAPFRTGHQITSQLARVMITTTTPKTLLKRNYALRQVQAS